MFVKFLHSKDVDKVLVDGTVVLSSLKYFRDLEQKQGAGIGDRLEGSTELTTPPSFVITEGSQEEQIANAANIGLGMFTEGFARVKGGGTINMGGAKFVHVVPDLHIFSYSEGEPNELAADFPIGKGAPYDACLEILNPPALAQALVREATINGKPPRIRGGVGDQVQYQDVSRNILQGGAEPPSPFKKSLFFKGQREYRIAFEMCDEMPPRLIFKIPHPERHFRQTDFGA